MLNQKIREMLRFIPKVLLNELFNGLPKRLLNNVLRLEIHRPIPKKQTHLEKQSLLPLTSYASIPQTLVLAPRPAPTPKPAPKPKHLEQMLDPKNNNNPNLNQKFQETLQSNNPSNIPRNTPPESAAMRHTPGFFLKRTEKYEGEKIGNTYRDHTNDLAPIQAGELQLGQRNSRPAGRGISSEQGSGPTDPQSSKVESPMGTPNFASQSEDVAAQNRQNPVRTPSVYQMAYDTVKQQVISANEEFEKVKHEQEHDDYGTPTMHRTNKKKDKEDDEDKKFQFINNIKNKMRMSRR